VTSARQLAYETLLRIDVDGAYANLALPAALGRSALDRRDRAFATDLVYGTTRMRRACDVAVDRFVTRAPDPDVRTLLRLGAYQLLFAGVSPHAAVSSTVTLAPRSARGFVNAVLRRVATEPVEWPDLPSRLSYPDWIVDRLTAELGHEDAVAALERMNQPPPVSEREDGYVQDLASQWVADLVDAGPGQRVADLCAAPGGKATRVAATGASVVAADLRPSRAGLIVANATGLGLAPSALSTVVADATAPPLRPGAFDRVLLDAPCSGLGALRRRPDARWRIRPSDVDTLAPLQRSMMAAARPLLRPGGVLVYSVCTLTAAESTDLDDGRWPVREAPAAPWRPTGRGARLLPQDADTDGMTVVRYVRPA
jgi:16S rRNA (cytosine967-C5)-methyltransferase